MFAGSESEWDAAVGELGHGTYCHLAGWRKIMTDALGHECFYWVARDLPGNITGLLPVVRVRSRLFGDYLLSMPFLNYGGPLGSDEARALLVEEAIGKARYLGVDLLELRARQPVSGGLETSHRKLTVLMDLPDDAGTLWEHGIRSKLRSQIRRPMKEGMQAHCGPELLDSFYGVFARTMRDLGTPVLSKRFFEAIREAFPAEAVFSVVEHQGRAVAAGCGFLWQGEFEITWAGALRRYSRLAPNMLLYWAVIEESIHRGAHTFNFGRCSPDSGTHRFKRQWPSYDRLLPWAYWSPTGMASTPDPNSRKFRWATAVWSRLPVPLTNLVGPSLSRVLP